MTFEKLLKWTIAETLDEVWSKSGVSPSKKTRETIIKAAEKISNELNDDFIRANKEYILISERWEDLLALRKARRKGLSANHATNAKNGRDYQDALL